MGKEREKAFFRESGGSEKKKRCKRDPRKRFEDGEKGIALNGAEMGRGRQKTV